MLLRFQYETEKLSLFNAFEIFDQTGSAGVEGGPPGIALEAVDGGTEGFSS